MTIVCVCTTFITPTHITWPQSNWIKMF